jgi:hypothetical protein
MSDLANRPSRAVREQRAYRLVVVSGVAATVFVVGLLLALFDVIGMGIPLIALVVAAVTGLMFRAMVRPRR